MPKLIDVAEAAAQMGVGADRVRELCRRGVLQATKVGNQWTIDAGSVRAATSRAAKQRAARQPARPDFAQSLTQIRNELRIQFVPDFLRFGDLFGDAAGVIGEARRRSKKFDVPVERIHVVEVAKDEVSLRPGCVLNPVDWLVYHPAIARIAPSIDFSLSNAVYSSRVDRSNNAHLTRPYAKQYAAWQRKTRRRLTKDGYRFMLSIDIVAYYEQIEIDELYRLVKPFDHGDQSWPIIRTMLREWAKDIRGLPQGPGASGILGNLYLKPLDDFLDGRPRITHLRYMDDIRVFSKGRSELLKVAAEIQRHLRGQKLDLKSDKTLLLPADAALAMIEDSDKDVANYLMKTDRPRARTFIRKMVRSALRKAGGPDRRNVEFGLRRLRKLGDGELLKLVLQEIDHLAPSGHVIAEFVAHFPNRKGVADVLANYLCSDNRNLWPHYEMWLLYALAEGTSAPPSKLLHRCRTILRDTGQPWWLRAAALDLLSTNPSDTNNAKAITDGIRLAAELPFFRQAAAIHLQRGMNTKPLLPELKRLGGPHAKRLANFLTSSPKSPERWLGG